MFKQLDPKHKNTLSKLWNQTQFSIWANLAKNQANSLYASIEKLTDSFRAFQGKIDLSYGDIRNKQLKLPIFHVISEELINSKGRVDNMLKNEADNIGRLIELLSDLRQTLQYGEITATKEYSEVITETLASNPSKITRKKILDIHEHYIKMDILQKIDMANSSLIHPFQKWYIDFSIRSEEFFRKVYSNVDPHGIQFAAFEQKKKECPGKENMRKESKNAEPIKDLCKEPRSMFRYREMEQESEDDIVKQIFRQIEEGMI